MAKLLRDKVAQMVVCGSVIVGTMGQVTPVFAQSVNENAVVNTVEVSTVSEQDPWEEAVANAAHYASIKVYHAEKDQDSMAAGFFTKESLPMEIKDGKVVVKLKVQKDPLGIENALTKLERKNADGTYEALTLQYANDEDVRYLVTEVEFADVEEAAVLKCYINTGFMTMSPELRILLTDETVDYIAQQTSNTAK